MDTVTLGHELQSVSGQWRVFDDINISHVKKNDIYRSPLEPGYVCWVRIWKENDGILKVSFVEVDGDVTEYPPVYNPYFAPERKIDWYTKTLVSKDGGKSWKDTGWKFDMDRTHRGNWGSHTRHVFQLEDGSLIGAGADPIPGRTFSCDYLNFDPRIAEQREYPQSIQGKFDNYLKSTSMWKSADGGEHWEKIYQQTELPQFWSSGTHRLKNGSIVTIGALLIPYSIDDWQKWPIALSESVDNGYTWSKPQRIAENDDVLISQGLCEENDFCELPDGRLLVVFRTCGPGMIPAIEAYLRRESFGKWAVDELFINPQLHGRGCPGLTRASDGTIFLDYHNRFYSCDEGRTWRPIEPGFHVGHYGQVVEASPGNIIFVTQKSIGDQPYPLWHDASIFQIALHYEKIDVAEQTDSGTLGAVATASSEEYADFHLCSEVRADGESGIAFNLDGSDYWFAAVAVPVNKFRGAAQENLSQEQDAALFVGKSTGGRIEIVRKMYAGKVVPGSWVELQLDKSGNVLKTAVKLGPQSIATYIMLKQDFGKSGKLGMFTNRSTGAFKNIRIARGAMEIRSNWKSSDADERLPLV